LEHKGFSICCDDRPIEPRGQSEHAPGSGLDRAQWLKIICESGPQVFRFPDIQDTIVPVAKAIHTRTRRNFALGRANRVAAIFLLAQRWASPGCFASDSARKRPV